ncbi:MAG TPA: hypothetical protein EYG74_07670 [Sulfurimonas autotrophica]|nr:hypothetical protein [Sulfurimonas autotrophica]
MIISAVMIYTSLGSIFPLFPPLIGIVYILWANSVREKEYIFITLWILYTVVLESIWGLPLYILWVTMLVMYIVIDPKIYHLLHANIFFKLIRVAVFDILYFLFIEGYEILIDKDIISESSVLLYYLFVDLAGVILL